MKNYIWDFDGTLFDTYTGMMRAVMQTLTEFDIKADPTAIYHQIKASSIRDLVTGLGLPIDAFYERYNAIETAETAKALPYPETAAMLAAISQRGGQHFIFTHREAQDTRCLLEKFDLADYFVEITSPADGFARKPSAEAAEYLMTKYCLELAETMMIGDRPIDIEVGHNAGIKTCFYDRDHFFPDIKADLVIDNLTKILEF